MLQYEFDQRVAAARERVIQALPPPTETLLSAEDIARALKKEVGFCNCDLDNWEPLRSTGHSSVCALHPIALQLARPYDAFRDKLAKEREARAESLLARLYHD